MAESDAKVLHLPPKRVAAVLTVIVAWALVGHFCVTVLQFFGYDYAMGAVGLFDFDYESNVPTLINASLHIVVAVMCFANLVVAQGFRGVWALGVALFLFFAVDETYGIHEPIIFVLKGEISETTAHLRQAIGVTFADILPYFVGAFFLCLIALFPFLKSLSRMTLVIVGFGISLFVLGAVVVDEVIAAMNVPVGWSWSHEILTCCEELAEMIGLVIVIYGLQNNLGIMSQDVLVRLTDANSLPLDRLCRQAQVSIGENT